jgi:16S rRNA (adenine1518-N6/adenine1519-N6)-dimethyltransferase
LPAPLKDVIARHGLLAKRSLGQHFLLDSNITEKIARSAGDLSGKNVIEVGPGPGGLTRALLASSAAGVYALEKDDRCVAALQELTAEYPGKLHLKAEDALKTDYAALCEAPRVIVANLPYNISTALLVLWLKDLPLFESMVLMFQKEVAERLTAETRTKDYGRISVATQWLCDAETVFDLPPEAFTPPPKITSTIVRLVPKPRTDDVAFATMERLTAAAFGQRRKMLRQSLKSLPFPEGMTAEKFLTEAQVAPTARAEEIDIAGFVRMAKLLENM